MQLKKKNAIHNYLTINEIIFDISKLYKNSVSTVCVINNNYIAKLNWVFFIGMNDEPCK